jgi:hypothetical protein
MNGKTCVVAAVLLALAASTQARTLAPTQAQLSDMGTVRRPARALAVTPAALAPVAFPVVSIELPSKSAIMLPTDFESLREWHVSPPSPPKVFNGLVPGSVPSRQPPVIPEGPTNVPAPDCHARPC